MVAKPNPGGHKMCDLGVGGRGQMVRLQRASPRPSHPPHTVLPWMRPNAEMQAVHGLWGTGEGAGWDTHRGRAGLDPYPQSRSHQPFSSAALWPLPCAHLAQNPPSREAGRTFTPRFEAPCHDAPWRSAGRPKREQSVVKRFAVGSPDEKGRASHPVHTCS